MKRALHLFRQAIPFVLWAGFFLLFSLALTLTIKFALSRGELSLLFLGHITGGTVFLGLGALQFLAQVRNRYMRFHRINGRIMLVAALISIGCLYAMLPNSQCNACMPSQITVTTLWLFSLVAAWIAIRRGDVAAHRIHMARGFVSASYFLIVRLVDQLIGLERLLPFVNSEDGRLANSDWLAWVVPVLVVEAITRLTTTHVVARIVRPNNSFKPKPLRGSA
jgi:uncharacterized membrane protein